MDNVPGATSCPLAVVVILMPSQAAACDTAGAIKSRQHALSPFVFAFLLNAEIYAGSLRGVESSIYLFIF